jgi:hypothetical protein
VAFAGVRFPGREAARLTVQELAQAFCRKCNKWQKTRFSFFKNVQKQQVGKVPRLVRSLLSIPPATVGIA